MLEAMSFLLLVTGWATANGAELRPAASAELRDPGGRMVARAHVNEMGDGIHVRIDAAGLAPGSYGAHLHITGRCDQPGFVSAGAHWNPTGRRHGARNPRGSHLGDLPNLEISASGTGRIDFHVPRARLRGGGAALLDGDGAAVVIHAGPDDYRTDPSGNSGARIACGVLRN